MILGRVRQALVALAAAAVVFPASAGAIGVRPEDPTTAPASIAPPPRPEPPPRPPAGPPPAPAPAAGGTQTPLPYLLEVVSRILGP